MKKETYAYMERYSSCGDNVYTRVRILKRNKSNISTQCANGGLYQFSYRSNKQWLEVGNNDSIYQYSLFLNVTVVEELLTKRKETKERSERCSRVVHSIQAQIETLRRGDGSYNLSDAELEIVETAALQIQELHKNRATKQIEDEKKQNKKPKVK